MRVELTDVGLSREERRALLRRVLLALSRFGPEVPSVAADLSEQRNPLGGVDRHCRVRARLRHGGEVRADAIAESFDVAIARAATLVAQRLDREFSGDSEPGPPHAR